ncbi:MAG TPA: hypothetical protein VHF24_09590 [Acidimicrobiales bacterium]|nr:hypothetical protein [Acidimicrobiales bacterium]
MIPRARPGVALLAAVLAFGSLATSGRAQEATVEAEVTVGAEMNLGEVLDVLTYRVHTLFVNPDKTVVERTVPAVVGVPKPVNVDTVIGPDLVVEIVPLPPNLITVSFTRTPTALGRLPVLAEILAEAPGGVSASFGFDAREGRTPPAFNGTFTFDLRGGSSLGATAQTAFPSTSPTLGVVAGVSTKGPDGTPVDPTTARADLSPVPGSMRVGVDRTDDPAAPRVDVTVETSSPTTVDVDATTVKGDVERRVVGTLDQLPENVTVGVTRELATGLHHIDYDASGPISHVDLDYLEKEDGVVDKHIVGRLDGVPTVIDADVTITEVPDGDDVKKTARVELSGNAAIGTAEVGFNKKEGESPLPEGIAEPVYAVAALDNENDLGVVSAAVRGPGVQTIFADTSDPLVVDVVSAGGALRANVTDTRPDGKAATMTGTLERVPGDVRVEFSPTAGTLTYDADDPIDVATFVLDDPAGIGSTGAGGPLESPRGVLAKRLDARVEKIPAGTVKVTFKPAGESSTGKPLVTLDAGEDTEGNPRSVGLVRALLTSGPEAVTALPEGADGVVVEDFANRFVAFAQLSGLRRLEVRTDGQQENRPGPVGARPVAHVEVDAVNDNPFVARLDREANGADEFLRAELSKLPPNLSIDLFAFDRIPCSEVAEDINLGDGVVLADGCKAFLIAPDGSVATEPLFDLDPDANGFWDTKVQGTNGVFEPSIGIQAIYRAGEVVDDVVVRTNMGGLPNPAFVHLEDVPENVELCLSEKETCTIEPGPPEREGITFQFDADGPMTVDAFLCQEPATGACTVAEGFEDLPEDEQLTRATQLKNDMKTGFWLFDVRLEDLSFEFHTRKKTPTVIFLDTGAKPVTGLFALKQERVSVNAALIPIPLGAAGVIEGAIDVDATIDLLPDLLRLGLDADISNFPGSALNADGMEISIDGVNPAFKKGLRCGETTNIDINADAPLEFLGRDLTAELCRAE